MYKFDKKAPEGTKDLLYGDYDRLKKAENTLEKIFKTAGYAGVKTPSLEFYDMFSHGVGTIPQHSMYIVSDYRGRLASLRPDSTKPVARLLATRLKDEKLPIRLFYNQPVFKRNKSASLLSDETYQAGIELIGDASTSADAEVLNLATKCLLKTCGEGFVLEIGHTGFFKELIASLNLSKETAASVRQFVEEKNYPALYLLLSSCGADKSTVEKLNQLPSLFGGEEVLERASKIIDTQKSREVIKSLTEIYNTIIAQGLNCSVFIDLGLINGYEYYSGLVFKGYAGNNGDAVLSGGRYDTLYSDYGLDLPAIGFAINTERLIYLPKPSRSAKKEKPITIALTKGRLEKDSAKLFEAAGIDCTPLYNKGRKLVVELCDGKYNVVFAKAADVITYVQHGACDLGIVGKDTIMEQGECFYEMLDLGFGRCRFALAAKKGSNFFKGYGLKRIATKYPNVARSYFDGKQMDVEIVKIDGSVELAPLLGLADGIIDIVETGSTLKANGLEVIEDVADISARVIVNVASLKIKKQGIEEFISLIKEKL